MKYYNMKNNKLLFNKFRFLGLPSPTLPAPHPLIPALRF